jgi:glycosyltransferase 2 family protein
MKRLISLLVSLAILAVIYWRIDFTRMVPVFGACDPLWLLLSLGLVVPLTLLTAWRLDQLMPGGARLGIAESNRLILVASVLNLVLPSKMGDLAKAWFMQERGHTSASLAFALVVFEKACDMLSLLLWCAFGLLLYPQKDLLFWIMTACVSGGLAGGVALLGSPALAGLVFKASAQVMPVRVHPKLEQLRLAWHEMHDFFWCDRPRLARVSATSVFIWFLHLVQIWMFTVALRAPTPFLANLALAPLAILAGLLPLTLAGIGTRDAALILLYHPYLDAPTAAALGILCTMRYVLPAVGGMPFVAQYLPGLKLARKSMSEKPDEK